MNHVRAITARTLSRRIGQVSRQRRYATDTPPQPTPPNPSPNLNPPKAPSRTGTYYKSFSYPVLKTFLIALFTYQITYYTWLKLEIIEQKHGKASEIGDLQEQLREAVAKQKAKAGDVVDEVAEAGRAVAESVREGTEEVVKTTEAVAKVAGGGWWPW
ncbi:hypothetical protein HBH68_029420 [Parastagonospora nodorum]|nr:hypothetical protein HBH75_059330 [Parastagonospora nodorum]KAH5223766.1 hypothetical protein HBH68_029420 [Parastagonospora nodorum]KAH5270474.1 hypothetical protein HBI72_062770 [Parastagonospora nodorum]KAH6044661.1 hypothetical protein HBI54_100370 [Parastagonospora nodorum]